MKHKNSRKLKLRINKAFRNLYEKNIIALSNFTCCGSCGTAEMSNIMEEDGFIGYAFYHMQETQCIEQTAECNIAYGEYAVVGEIVSEELKKVGLSVDWDGNLDTRILVSL